MLNQTFRKKISRRTHLFHRGPHALNETVPFGLHQNPTGAKHGNVEGQHGNLAPLSFIHQHRQAEFPRQGDHRCLPCIQLSG